MCVKLRSVCVKLHHVCVKLHTVCEITQCAQSYTYSIGKKISQLKNFTLTPWAAWATNISCAVTPSNQHTQNLACFKTKETDYSATATFLLSNAVSIRREQFFSRQKHTAGLFIRPWEKQRKGTEYRTSAYLIFVISFTQTGLLKSKFYTQKTTNGTKNTKNDSEKSNICISSLNLEKFTPDRIFLHRHRLWCLWQI